MQPLNLVSGEHIKETANRHFVYLLHSKHALFAFIITI